MGDSPVERWVRQVFMFAALACVFVFIGEHASKCNAVVKTQRCMHDPVPQPDGTTLCRSYERRVCVATECGPWEASK